MALVSLNVAPDYSSSEAQPVDYTPTLWLSEEQCKALGIDGAIDAGTVIGMNVRAVVTRSTTSIDNPDEVDDKDVCLTLSITDAEIVAPASSSQDGAAKKLYGKSDAD